MEGPNRERWEELCRQAAVEKDPKKPELAAEINRLLQEKEKRLQQQRQGTDRNESPWGSFDEPLPKRNRDQMRAIVCAEFLTCSVCAILNHLRTRSAALRDVCGFQSHERSFVGSRFLLHSRASSKRRAARKSS